MAITRPQVFEAADRISRAGQAPTVANVRAHLGTGSFTTITAMLRDWKAQASQQEAPTPSDVPEEVTAALARAAELVWTAAQAEFARELSAVRKSADLLVIEANHRADEAEAEIVRLEAEAETTAQKLARVHEDYDHCMTDAEHKADTLAELRTKVAALSASLKSEEARCREQAALLVRLTPAKPSPKRKTVEPVKADPAN